MKHSYSSLLLFRLIAEESNIIIDQIQLGMESRSKFSFTDVIENNIIIFCQNFHVQPDNLNKNLINRLSSVRFTVAKLNLCTNARLSIVFNLYLLHNIAINLYK